MAYFTASRRRPLILALGLFVFTVAVFHDVLFAGFVRWDDDLHVYANPYLHPVSLAHLGRFWTAPYQNLYVPLSYTLYSGLACLARLPAPVASADGLWVDFDPRVFHAASLLLHGANVLLVFALLRRLLPGRGTAGSDGAACAGALLFAVHPLQVESVAWIAELRGLLAGFCGLAALHAWQSFLESPSKRRGYWGGYGWATLLFALALLAKPSAVALPLMAWALVWWKGTSPSIALPTSSALPNTSGAWRLGLAGWGVLCLLALGVTHGAQPVTVDIVAPVWSRPWIAADALAFDLSKLLWPAHLGIDYGRSPLWLRAHGGGYATGTLLFALGTGVWALRRHCPALTFGASLFAAALLPTLGLTPFVFQVFSTVADRYLYLALLGPAFLLAWTLARWGQNPSETAAGRRLRLAAGCFCAGVLLVCAERCSLQALTWRSSTALFGQALAVNPQSWAACNNLALIALDEGQPLDALPLLSEAIHLRPDFAEAHANRGVALLRLGARPAAEREFSAAVRLKPSYAFAYGGLGDSLMAQGRAGEAAAAFRQALALQPGSTQVREALRVAEGRALAVSR